MLDTKTTLNFGRRLSSQEIARIESQPQSLFGNDKTAYTEIREIDPNLGKYELVLLIKQHS